MRMPMAGCTMTVASTAPATIKPSAVVSRPANVAVTSTPPTAARAANVQSALAPDPARTARAPPRTWGDATLIGRSDHPVEERWQGGLAAVEQDAEHLRPRT